MALERQSIERKDFPIGRRGYDPEAVDAHLSTVADEVDELKSSARKRSETLASSASDQVRAIIEAAETSAAEIQRQAEDDVREIREEANNESQRSRTQATEQAREHVGRVSEATAVMLQRLDAMESELGALIESLRTGSNRLNADLQLLEGNLTDVTDAAGPRPRFEREAAREEAPMAFDERGQDEGELFEEQAQTAPELGLEAETAEPTVAHGAAPEPTEDEEPGDLEAARLIALNMALNGTPREETDRYLAENFQISNRDRLLDEVYASVEG